MALTLTVLLENRRAAGAGKTLLAKPGLSLLVQDETTTILFDTGRMAASCITLHKWAWT